MKKLLLSVFLLALTNITYTETAKQKLCRILGISPISKPTNPKKGISSFIQEAKKELALSSRNPFICIPHSKKLDVNETRMTIPFNPRAQKSFREKIEQFFKRS